MTSLWCSTILLLISCRTSTGDYQVTETQNYSEAFSNLLYVLNGKFSDLRLVEAYKNINDPDVDVPSAGVLLAMPVEIPALAPAVTYFFEEYFEKTLLRRLICVLWENSNGEMFLQPYNITSPSNDMSRSFTLDQIKLLTSSDLKTRQECKAKFERKGVHTFTSFLPDCDDKENGVVPKYVMTWSCNSLLIIANNPNQDEYSASPIVNIREGSRYPFPSYLKEVEDKVSCE
ncbi:uncharacterized protein LOC131954272 [Physella acuta]|uniref:uncharacterized protein LOC131954272 n=1 Tax=Physella acuta TaxID=109671 RepID=UPI0027DD9A85|nr:uncharacterized protein LOC131954272 [Physella acuta]